MLKLFRFVKWVILHFLIILNVFLTNKAHKINDSIKIIGFQTWLSCMHMWSKYSIKFEHSAFWMETEILCLGQEYTVQ